MSSHNILIKDLIEYGLSEKEAQVYIALLELEIAPVNEVAKKSGVNRSSAYVVLESLKEKGLVATSDDKSVQQFVPSSPDVLLRSARESAKKQESVLEKIQDVVPELKGLHKDTKQRPKVRVFEGIEGIKRVYEDALSCKKGSVMKAFSLPQVWDSISDKYFDYLKDTRMSKGINLKAVYPYQYKKDPRFPVKNNTIRAKYTEIRFLPKRSQNPESDFRIYEDKIAIVSRPDNIGIIIESKKITESLETVFDMVWSSLKE